jgi:hypothetical protein
MTDHHYARLDLATLVSGLDQAGIPMIEVGHGNGVGCHLFKDPKLRTTAGPLLDDDDHAAIALRVASRAKVGVILTAGRRFAPLEYIDHVADLGFAFIRLAAMPDEIDDELFAYVRRIKDRKMIASINMMQTYAKSPREVGELAARAAGAGVDWFYIVDSGGGMSTGDVEQYVTAVLGAANVEVGLHAHNNLGCAVANCLAAVSAGATLVDGTLNGIGRATGNPATEQLAVALRDRIAEPVDLDALVVLGSAVRSLFDQPGNDPLDFISGGALVHSRNVPKVLEAARERDRSPCAFLLAVGTEARRRGTLTAFAYDDDLYATAQAASPAVRRAVPSDAAVAVATEDILGRWSGGPDRAISELSTRSRQRHLPSVVHVSRSAPCNRPVPWETATVAGITIPASLAGAWDVPAHRRPDYVLVEDGDAPIAANIATWRIPFAEIHARSVQDLRTALANAGVDAVIASEPLDRTRVQELRAAGKRVVQPAWWTAVAQFADAQIALHADLARASDGLVSGVQVPGPGEAAWDPDRAALLDAEDPEAAARRAAAAYLGAIFSARRRL